MLAGGAGLGPEIMRVGGAHGAVTKGSLNGIFRGGVAFDDDLAEGMAEQVRIHDKARVFAGRRPDRLIDGVLHTAADFCSRVS